MRFTDKVCLVTGAGSGIGKAVAKELGKEGGKVEVIDLNERHACQAAQEITTAQGEAIYVKCDVGDPPEVQAAIKSALPWITGAASMSW
jgi:glucose 1-dehydrogenase